jgi:surface polysaccharide O-acyltransferase-like enzyme
LQNLGGYIGYYTAGYVLKNSNLRINKWIYPLGFLAGYSVTVCGYYWQISHEGKLNPYFYGYLSPNVILVSVCIFMFFKDVLNREIYPKIINPLDSASFGIYLSHYLIITILSHKFMLNWAWNPPLIGIFAHAGLTLIIAFILTWVISKLPKGYWIMG